MQPNNVINENAYPPNARIMKTSHVLRYQIEGDSLDAAGMKKIGAVFATVSACTFSVELDLSDVDFVDSAGLRAILLLKNALATRNSALTLSRVNQQPRQALQLIKQEHLIAGSERNRRIDYDGRFN